MFLHAINKLGNPPALPGTRSVVVDYRNVGIISPAVRKRYQWHYLVQLVVACALVQLGQSRKLVSNRIQSFAPNELVALLELLPLGQGAPC